MKEQAHLEKLQDQHQESVISSYISNKKIEQMDKTTLFRLRGRGEAVTKFCINLSQCPGVT